MHKIRPRVFAFIARKTLLLSATEIKKDEIRILIFVKFLEISLAFYITSDLIHFILYFSILYRPSDTFYQQECMLCFRICFLFSYL